MSQSNGQLASIVSRIERLEAERKALADDVKEIYQEAKSGGFEVKVVRRLIRERRQDEAEREEIEALLEVYRHALGQIADMPLGQAALAKVA